ncbi:MAG TPA: PIG-L family deacetylase [Candidatus Limnocylindrales bacterium]|nr:PIG-L family deacetylase [Candidatus Limnocylindrales bacterium]
MAHVFIAPHPDDVALSCGGLIASLRELGQNVAIVTVFSGGAPGGLTDYQREALGFGSKAMWPNSEAFNRAAIAADVRTDGDGVPAWLATEEQLESTQADADAAAKRFWQRSSWYRRASIRRQPLAGQALMEETPTQGSADGGDVLAAASAGDAMATRRLEDERYAYFAESSIVFLDLPDAVFRGYERDDQLLGRPHEDDAAPSGLLRSEIARLEPQRVYFPLGVGGHVDHRLCRAVGLGLRTETAAWTMPSPDWRGSVVFYEDFPYAWWSDFRRIDDLPSEGSGGLPAGLSLTPEYADIGDQLERKIRGISIYESQIGRTFGSTSDMADAVRLYGQKIGSLSGRGGSAERYWVATRY